MIRDRLSPDQRRELIALVEAIPWGDMDAHIRTVEDALVRAVEATSEDFRLWQEQADDGGLHDEFALEPEDVDALTPEWRLAYVARLLRSLTMFYGLRVTEFARNPSRLRVDEDSIAALVHGINDLVHLPTAPRRP